MTFFISGNSNCRICSKSIAERIEAVQLDWVHPDDVGDLAHFGRSFVHRNCWLEWEHKDTFASAARNLRLKSTDEEALIEHHGVFLYERGSNWSIEDVFAPIHLSISATEKLLVPDWFVDVISEGPGNIDEPPKILAMGNHSISAMWWGDELKITISADGQECQRFTLSALQRTAWLAVLQKLLSAK